MKNILTSTLSLLILCFAMCGSSDDDQLPPKDPNDPSSGETTDLISSVAVTNKYNATATVDNKARVITIGLTKNSGDGSDLKIKLSLGKKVNMYYPQTEEAEYNITTKPELWVKYMDKEYKYTIKKEEIVVDDVDPISIGWTTVDEFGVLSEGVKVYKSPSRIFDKNIIAYVAIIDMNLKEREFKILGSPDSPSGKTPTQFFNETDAPIIINGGYFWYSSNTGKLHHIGMLVQDGKVNSSNATTSTRKNDKGQDATFYPTRAVFSLSQSNSFACNWAYTISNETYAYPEPSGIKALQAPLPQPTSIYPVNGWKLNSKEAIGAGPLLLYNGEKYNTWEAEIWDDIGGINPTHENVPRSAIGVTENKKIILLAAEGRNITADTPGLSTDEVAQILKSLGCVDAMNLDGGGSSCMLINGRETIQPSGNGIQRAVVTAIAIK